MGYTATVGARHYHFSDLKDILAKASAERAGDMQAGIAALTSEERMAARSALAHVPLKRFLSEVVIPYEQDEITRLIVDDHDAVAFALISHLTVGDFRDWLLSDVANSTTLAQIARGVTPEMASAVSKLMRNQDLILVAKKCHVVTKFRNTLGLPGRMAVRLQPNHPTDDPRGISASILDGLLYGSGDAVIGVNPASDNVENLIDLAHLLDEIIQRYAIPTQSCVLTHVTNTLQMISQGAPVDLVFQSIAGTEKANTHFGINLALLAEAQHAALALQRGALGNHVMYFETGSGSRLSVQTHGIDRQTCNARAYAVARKFNPLLVNSMASTTDSDDVPDTRQIIRASLEDHFCGKLLGLPVGCNIAYTLHAQPDQDDMDNLLTLLAVAGVTFITGIPGSDDALLNDQTTSFHDALYIRNVLGLKRAPEFETWLENMKVIDTSGQLLDVSPQHPLLALLPLQETPS